MAKQHWQSEPDEHDFPAAAQYLSLLLPEAAVEAVVETLRTATIVHREADDLLRASRLPILPGDTPLVARELKKVKKGKLLSPVLLVRGRLPDGIPLTVADGYHRICASYHIDEDGPIPCLIADLRAK